MTPAGAAPRGCVITGTDTDAGKTVVTAALLRALLEPTAQLRQLEVDGDYTARLALLEEQKCLPWQAIWEMYCQRHDTPAGSQWLDNVRAYENAVLSQRG